MNDDDECEMRCSVLSTVYSEPLAGRKRPG